jgi:hypothetical protein
VFRLAPLAFASNVRAQQPGRVPVIGIPSPFIDAESNFLAGLRQGLNENGLREGADLHIEYRSTEGRVDRIRTLAADLIARWVDVIVTASASCDTSRGCIRESRKQDGGNAHQRAIARGLMCLLEECGCLSGL